jgi:Putative phage abortive infection protein
VSSKRFFWIIGLVGAAWLTLVVISGQGVRLFGWTWDFQTVGQLGDSFGALSAVMASLAAIFTLQALQDERAETKRLRDREKARDAAERERDHELTFFRMLDLRREILADADFSDFTATRFNFVVKAEDREKFQETYKNYQNGIGIYIDHYFRFTYHILKFVDSAFEFPRAYFYSRLLRAQLSSGEQFMIAMNALFGAGRDKMLPLIEKYGFLHTMSDGDRDLLLKLDAGLDRSAFESHGDAR